MSSSKRILVIDAAGHLCIRLLWDGQTVICLDGMGTGREDNLAPLLDNPASSYTQGTCGSASTSRLIRSSISCVPHHWFTTNRHQGKPGEASAMAEHALELPELSTGGSFGLDHLFLTGFVAISRAF